MKPSRYLPLLMTLPLFAFGEIRSSDMEFQMARRLSARGVSFGFDAKTGRIVTCGTGRIGGGRTDDGWKSMNRNICHRMAYLDAQAKILECIRLQNSSDRSVVFAYDGVSGFKSVDEVQRALASGVLVGEVLLDVVEAEDDDALVIGLALAWSHSDADAWHLSLSGSRQPAESWKSELERQMEKSDDVRWRNFFNFRDSKGALHPVGIGCGEFSEEDLLRSVSLSVARAMAKKNLLLALNGNAMLQEECRKKRLDQYRHDENGKMRERSFVESCYEKLATLEWQGETPSGLTEICLTRPKDRQAGRREVVVVCTLDAWKNAGTQIPDKEAVDANRGPLKVFNPATGKYETTDRGRTEYDIMVEKSERNKR